jgi:hypothetical protein
MKYTGMQPFAVLHSVQASGIRKKPCTLEKKYNFITLNLNILTTCSLPPYLPRKVVIGSKYEDVRSFLKRELLSERRYFLGLLISGSLEFKQRHSNAPHRKSV